MGQKEKFVQPEVEREEPKIPAEVKAGFERFGLDFEEEFLALVREYNTDGLLEILPDTEALGVVSAKGEEIPVHEIEDFAIRFGKSHWQDLEVTGGTKAVREKQARKLIKELRAFFGYKLINRSPIFRSEISHMDFARLQSKEIFVRSFANLSITIQYDWLMNYMHNKGLGRSIPRELETLIPVLHQENMSRAALLLLDKSKISVVVDNFSSFSGLNQNVLDALWDYTDYNVHPGYIYQNKSSFAADVDWSREEEFLEQGGVYEE